MIRFLVTCAVTFAVTVWAQGNKTPSASPSVKAPNEGPVRIYLASQDEVYSSAARAAEDFGLDVAKAPDGALFIASPGPWTRPYKGVTFTHTFIVRVRSLNPKETEIAIEDEGKDSVAVDRINAFHERLGGLLAESRSKKPLSPKHPQEVSAEATIIKPIDLANMRPYEDREELRVWNLGYDSKKAVNTAVWKLAGHVPLHFTPLSERRFLVTEGSVKLTIGNRMVWVSAGDFAVVPKAVRMQIDVEPSSRATLYVVETPAVDDTKTIWLEPKEPKTASGAN